MKIKISSFLAAFGVFTAVFFASCGDDNTGIFYRLSHMEKIEDNSLNNSLTIGGMCELGGRYYIAAGRIYRRSTASGSIWEEVPSPRGYQLCFDLVTDGTRLFAAYFNRNSGDKRLFSDDGTGSGIWTLQNDSDISGRNVENLKITSNNRVFLSVKNSGSDDYYVFNGAAGASINFTPCSIKLPDTNSTFFDVTLDGATYWLATDKKVYSGNNPDSLASGFKPSGGDKFCGIFRSSLDSNNSIFLTSRNKKIYARNGGSWGNSDSLNFYPNDIGEIDRGGGDMVIVIGTEGKGYLEQRFSGGTVDRNALDFRWPSSSYSYAADAGFVSYELQYSVITGFYTGSSNRVFALTAGEGLWRNEPNPSLGSRKWSHE